MLRLVHLALASLLVALVPDAALAGRIATPSEKKAIAAGARLYMRTSGCCATTRAKLTLYRVSTVDPDFAKVTIFAITPSGRTGPRATAVLVHTYRGRWVTLALGTARLACGLQPAVRRDLGLAPCR